ncbi:MAG TPA: rhodanese-like domain-containing protein [Thermoanaerobaculia bacterium]|jgi:thiosulfate/3-mercaptopyruvate sulfurtransferase
MFHVVLSLLFAVAGARDSLVVTPAWLAQHLHDPNLVLLHVSDKEGYEAAHIPGARYVSMSDLSISNHTPKGLMLEMPPADELKKHLEALGISDDSRVVVYYGEDWVSPSTRILFTLDYAGLGAHSSLLDGGQDAWVANGGAVTKEVPAAKTGELAPLKTKPIVVDAAFVNAHIGAKGFAIVDGRSSNFYSGESIGGQHGEKHRRGHVKSAKNIPYDQISDDHDAIKSNAQLQALFTKAGVKSGDTVIGYCHIGQQATAMLFAARLLGHPVLLYDGSFQDWSRHTEYPVEASAAK